MKNFPAETWDPSRMPSAKSSATIPDRRRRTPSSNTACVHTSRHNWPIEAWVVIARIHRPQTIPSSDDVHHTYARSYFFIPSNLPVNNRVFFFFFFFFFSSGPRFVGASLLAKTQNMFSPGPQPEQPESSVRKSCRNGGASCSSPLPAPPSPPVGPLFGSGVSNCRRVPPSVQPARPAATNYPSRDSAQPPAEPQPAGNPQ